MPVLVHVLFVTLYAFVLVSALLVLPQRYDLYRFILNGAPWFVWVRYREKQTQNPPALAAMGVRPPLPAP